MRYQKLSSQVRPPPSTVVQPRPSDSEGIKRGTRAAGKRGTLSETATKLSDAKVRAAKGRAKPYKLTDSNRLFLLVTPSGGKLWRWGYAYDGKQKSIAFGAYLLVSLGDARSKRDEAYTALCATHSRLLATYRSARSRR